MTAGGGYGVLYGPNIDTSGKPTWEGKIPGQEASSSAMMARAHRTSR